jgi:hypothetical protein
MQCEEVTLVLAEVAPSDDAALPLATSHHLEGCLRCQAELAQYRKLLRGLSSLRDVEVTPDATLLDEILEALRPPAPVLKLKRRDRRKAILKGVGAAAATGAAGAFVAVSKLNRSTVAQ